MDAAMVATLITMYGKCGSVEEAVAVYRSTKQLHNVVVDNAMMVAFTRCDRATDALDIFWKMKSPLDDSGTVIAALGARKNIDDGRCVHTLLLQQHHR